MADPIGARSSSAELQETLLLVGEDLSRVDRLLEEQFRSDVRLIDETGRYIREGGGKRIRPALLLLACRLCGYQGERAVLFASVVEFIHTATLLHDDIIDEATIRRGRRSVNSRFGNDLTVLLGDYLYTKSMAMALSQENLGILRLLSAVTLRMIEGELLEIERSGDLGVTEEQYLEIIRRKTADLFACCMRIGARLSGVDARREEALAGYGLSLGICFQMVDDILDFTADERVLGKPVANDLREGKLTLPMIYLLERGGPGASRKLSMVVEDRCFARVDQAEVVRLAEQHGAFERARRRAAEHADAASAQLRQFEPSPFREALSALPGFVLGRDH